MTHSDTDASTDDSSTDDSSSVPQVWDHLSTIREKIESSERLLLCLDFDGTLAPIVEEPSEATTPADTERVLQRVADRSSVDVAIISGRELSNLRARVDVSPVVLAGNHGLEIERGETEWLHPVVDEYAEELDEVRHTLEQRLIEVPGAFLEDKGLTATVHYRRASADAAEVAREIVDEEVSNADSLVVTEGKRIFEVRPAIDWHKGRAVMELMDDDGSQLTVYVGDDETDEDAHRELADTDHVGVAVGREQSAADYRVHDPDDVRELLEHVADVDIGTRT